ncbi:MAG: hypothetical protein FWE60_00795 [Oscillospiraceae bacterium]|nr:hypothetical protein [Oscillospiraceae bacterium]
MKKPTEFKSISALLKNDKAVKIIVAAGFALIMMILLWELFSFGRGAPPTGFAGTPLGEGGVHLGEGGSHCGRGGLHLGEGGVGGYTEQLEGRLTAILSEIQGVGRVSVMLTLESLDEAPDVPRVRGAAVVCEGGDDVFVKKKVVETVSKVLGISTARVSVTY